jgi:hypothetical protein
MLCRQSAAEGNHASAQSFVTHCKNPFDVSQMAHPAIQILPPAKTESKSADALVSNFVGIMAAGGFAPRGVCGNHTILPARRKCLDAVCQAHGILNPACPSIQL